MISYKLGDFACFGISAFIYTGKACDQTNTFLSLNDNTESLRYLTYNNAAFYIATFNTFFEHIDPTNLTSNITPAILEQYK